VPPRTSGTTRRPRKYEPGWSGDLPSGQGCGKYTDQKCPREGCSGKVVYNGNYFCEHWTWRPSRKVDYDAGECDYALPHPQTEYLDRLLSWNLTREWECELPDSMHRHTTKPEPGEVCTITWPVNGGLVNDKTHLDGGESESDQ